MNVTASTGSGLAYRTGASRAAVVTLPGASPSRLIQSAADDAPTRVTFGRSVARGAAYSDPRTTTGRVRLWSSPDAKNDSIGVLMARNRDMGSQSTKLRLYNLSDQWRGLGGAMLTRFAKTGENYTQTLADEHTLASEDRVDALPPAEQAQRAADILTRQAAELADLATDAPAASLKIQTRSGESVELKISVKFGDGMKVELKASASMSVAERAAVEQLADGLDRALEGLGPAEAVGLDLSGLMHYDRDAIASIDLTANNGSHQALDTFSMHLGDDKRRVALKGIDGEMKLNVDTEALTGNALPQQRRAAIQRTLDRMDRAGERGQANAALVKQMKSAFTALQTADTADGDGNGGRTGQPGPRADSVTVSLGDAHKSVPAHRATLTKPLSIISGRAPVDSDVASRLSGLADFDASFGGETHRSNRYGATNQAGRVDYRLSQKTTTKDAAKGGRSVAETVSEQLSADFLKAPGDAMLDTRNGNFSETRIRDSSTVTSLIEADADRVTRVLRKTDEHQLQTVTDFASHRLTHRQSWPSQRSLMERLH